jgi:hypothetical protein
MAIKDSTDLIKHLAHTQSQDDIDYLLRERVIYCHLPADAAAADATNYILLEADENIELVSAKITCAAAVALNASDYATLDLNIEDGAAGGLTSIDSFTTAATTLAARVAKSWSGIAVTDTLDAGEILVLEVTKTGSGVVITDCMVEVKFRYL